MNPQTQQIHCGDNLTIMRTMSDESVNLIYLDPPFFSGRNYEVIWKDGTEERSFKDTEWYRVECPSCSREVVKAERFCPTCGTDLTDAKITRKNDIYAYIDWMIPRLTEMHRILKPTGSIYLHADWHAVHYLKIEMDRIFGMNNYINEIIWHYPSGNSPKISFGKKHDTIMCYAKSKEWCFNESDILIPYDEKELSRFKETDGDGRRFYWNSSTKTGKYKTYLTKIGKNPGDVWTITTAQGKERLGYPTQKPEALLKRIIKASSNEGDIVFDPFCGCGTTLAVASKLNRSYIGIDISPTSCMVIADRIKYNEIITGMKYTADQYQNMEPHEFQNIVCNSLQAKNTSPDPKKASGADGGIDGVIKSNLTHQFSGALIQVKRSKSVGINTIKNLESTMRDNNQLNGFVVAISFGKGANEQVKKIKNRGINIILIEAKELNSFDFNDYIAL